MTRDEDSEFAPALRAAIAARGLSLERIQARLSAAGVPVSRATLSYWQTGRSRPERERSLITVSLLESILGLEDGALVSLLPSPRPRGRKASQAARMPSRDVILPTGDTVGELLTQLGFPRRERLTRVTIHDRVTVGGTRHSQVQETRILLRADDDGAQRFPVFSWLSADEAVMPRVEGVASCHVGRMVRAAEANLVCCEMLLPRPLAKGEHVMVQYISLMARTEAASTLQERAMVTSPLVAVFEIQFDPSVLPTRAWSYRRHSIDGEPQRLEELQLIGHSLQTSFFDPGPGVHGVEWEWD